MTTTTTITKTIQDLTPADVRSAYRGRANACMCGCKGKHYYVAALREEASTDRGYPVTDDEVSDAKVTKILRLVQAYAEDAEIDDSDIISVDVGSSAYVVYLRNGVTCSKEPLDPARSFIGKQIEQVRCEAPEYVRFVGRRGTVDDAMTDENGQIHVRTADGVWCPARLVAVLSVATS
jgi:hypothetical protein